MKNKYLSIIFVLIISYFTSLFLEENVFLVDSPKIRPNLGEYLLAKTNNTKEKIIAKLNFDFSLPRFNQERNNSYTANNKNEQTIEFLKNNLEPITKGVSAASKNGVGYTKFNIDEIEWAKITYTLKNGKVITIQYPKGTNPPPSFIYENQNE